MKVIRLHLLCAASTRSIRSGSFPSDEPLDSEGQKALAAFAGALPLFDKIWISPALCAAQTADGLGFSGAAHSALRECDFGRWAGRSLAELHASEPDALSAWLNDPSAAPHGGESFAQVLARVRAFMDNLLEEAGSILAITHPPVIRASIACALGVEPRIFRNIDVAPLTQVRISGAYGRWTLSALLPYREAQ